MSNPFWARGAGEQTQRHLSQSSLFMAFWKTPPLTRLVRRKGDLSPKRLAGELQESAGRRRGQSRSRRPAPSLRGGGGGGFATLSPDRNPSLAVAIHTSLLVDLETHSPPPTPRPHQSGRHEKLSASISRHSHPKKPTRGRSNQTSPHPEPALSEFMNFRCRAGAARAPPGGRVPAGGEDAVASACGGGKGRRGMEGIPGSPGQREASTSRTFPWPRRPGLFASGS